jgi:hypothetical protein
MTFDIYEHVKIKKNGIIGQIVDIINSKSGPEYTVESDTKGERDDADYPGEWPLYFCKENEIEKI